MRPQSLYLAALSGAMLAAAQEISYTTSTVTACFDHNAGLPTPAPGGPPPGRGCLVIIPGCGACDCDTCDYTATYTTKYPAFCSTGVVDVTYTVTEVRKGMSSPPHVTDRPGVPDGFTTAVETCTVCGDEPLTKTMTYPVDGVPYVPVETGVAVLLDSEERRPDENGKPKQPEDDEEHVQAAAPGRILFDLFLAGVAVVFAV